MKRNQWAILAALTWSIAVTVLICIPGSTLPQKNWFEKVWIDKWVHIGLFAIMVFLWCRVSLAISEKKNRLFFQIAFYFFLYGVAMEFVQKYYIPNRSFEVGDIMADGIGTTCGLIISLRVYIKK